MVWLAFAVPLARAGVVADGLEAWERGDVDAALTTWSSAGAPGARSGVVEYDLGTAWLRKDDPARALARFLAAARLRPRDADVQHDVALCRAALEERSPASLPAPVASSPIWGRVVVPGELGVVGVLATALGSVALLFRRRYGLAPGSALWLAGLSLGATGAWGSAWQADHPLAVVVEAEVVVRDAPDAGAGERTRLPLGTEVRVDRSYGDFLLVEDGRGRRGWVAVNGLELAWGESRARERTPPPAG